MNIKLRLKNPVVWVQIILSCLTVALTYNSLQPTDLTTWNSLFTLLKGIVSNPYLLFTLILNAWSIFNDPTTKGLGDSKRALEYEKPSE